VPEERVPEERQYLSNKNRALEARITCNRINICNINTNFLGKIGRIRINPGFCAQIGRSYYVLRILIFF
jgi:hypothetical protein